MNFPQCLKNPAFAKALAGKQKFYIISSVVLTGLFFFAGVSSASANYGENQKSFSFVSFFNPIASLVEKVVKDFGYDIALAAAPDPDLCGTCLSSDSVGCSGSSPTAVINWEAGPAETDLYHLLTISPAVSGSPFNTGPVNSYIISSGLVSNTTYNWSVEAFWWNGNSASYTNKPCGSFTTPNCVPPPPIASISADSTSIPYNTATTIRWSSTNATSCTVFPPSWTGTSGTQSTGNLTSLYTYTLGCDGPGGSVSASVTVTVGGAPTLTFSADSTSVAYNTGTTLRWSSANTVTCTASGDWSGGKSLSGSEGTGNLTSSKTYNLTCSNVGGSVTKSVTVSVGGAPLLPPSSYTLTVYKIGTGSGTVTPSTGIILSWIGNTGTVTLTSGTNLLLNAYNASGSSFSGWSGDCTSISGATCSVTMNANKNVTVTFTLSPVTPTYVIAPSFASRQVGTAQQIFIGWYDPDGPSGAQVQQNVTSSATWTSSNTSVATISNGISPALVTCFSAGDVTITSVYSGLTATASFNCFNVISRQITVTKSGTGSGTVTSNPAALNCGSVCSAAFFDGSSVTLTASPSSGSIFGGWSGACSGAGACALTMDADKSVNATFSLPLPGDFSLSLGGSVACNSVPLSWTAASGADGYRIFRESPRVDLSPYQPYTALNFTDTTVSQNTTYLYQIEAYNSGGTNRSNAKNVTTPYCPPTLNFSATPTSIYQGQSSTLSWVTSYTYSGNSCTASGAWSGNKAGSGGSEVVIPSPPPSVTYNLQCSGPGGSASGSATINILPLFLPDWREIIPR